MDASFSAQGEQLRAVAKSLRDDVLDELNLALRQLPQYATSEDCGPTVSPAAQQFLDAWRAELRAVTDAVTQLSDSLDEAAYNYDNVDEEMSCRIDSTQ